MVLVDWKIRDENIVVTGADYARIYGKEPGLCALKIHLGGAFTEIEDRRYVNGKVSYVDFVDVDLFSVLELDAMMLELGYKVGQIMYYHYLLPNGNLDVHAFSTLVTNNQLNEVEIYIEHGFSKLKLDLEKLKQGKVTIEEISSEDEQIVAKGKTRSGISSRLMLEWQEPMIGLKKLMKII